MEKVLKEENVEITFEELEKLLLDDLERQISFETDKGNIGADIKCVVAYIPLEDNVKRALCFENERTTIIKIPYESVKKISAEKHFDGLWKTITIHCSDKVKYRLIF